MTHSKQNKKGGFSIIAGVTGAIIGAGAAIAGAVALQDKKNRNKVKKVFADVKKQAAGYIEKIQKEVKKEEFGVKKNVKKGKAKAKKIVKISTAAKKKI